MANKIQTIVGIDEVGRGPLAGPITICACSVPWGFDFAHFEGIRDSKKLSAQKRREWFEKIYKLKDRELLSFALASVGAGEIDSMGLTHSLKKAISTVLHELKSDPETTEVRLDGSLYAPEIFSMQRTIIKGDEKEPVISAASIIAKVTRDKMMEDYSLKYPGYGFDEHKGYGTAAHMKALHALGPSPIHRRLFLRKFLEAAV